MSERNLLKLEALIKGKMGGIKNKTLTPCDSGIGKLMNMMKALDEPLYEKMLAEYKVILK